MNQHSLMMFIELEKLQIYMQIVLITDQSGNEILKYDD